jgi:CheY-like chemotaxis protein
MDGAELANHIHGLLGNAAPPLVLLTSLGRREAAGPGQPFAASLTRPVKASQLYTVLAALLSRGAPPVKDAREQPRAPARAEPLPLRLLLAEDNAVNQKVALRTLERLGYRADLAGNGLEVLDALRRQPYDVVLMDVQMPELDGLEATRRLRRELTPERQPYIIAMTANAMRGDREICLAAGMDAYLSKPVRIEELAAALEQYSTRVPPQSPATPAIDVTALRDTLDDGDNALLAEIMGLFVIEAEASRFALAATEAQALFEAAHKLKGSAATVGARDLSARCEAVEALVRQGDFPEAHALVPGVIAALDLAIAEARGMLAGPGGA